LDVSYYLGHVHTIEKNNSMGYQPYIQFLSLSVVRNGTIFQSCGKEESTLPQPKEIRPPGLKNPTPPTAYRTMAAADANTAASAAPDANMTTANPSASDASAKSAAGAQNNAQSPTDTAIPRHCIDDGRLKSIAASSSCFHREREVLKILTGWR
jgi:hypothetical protein